MGMRIVVLMTMGICVVGCSVGTVNRVHIDDEPVRDIGTSDVDVRAMTREMASAIVELPAVTNAGGPVHIAFLDMKNRTQDPDFDSYNLLSQIRQLLIQYSNGKLAFLDRERIDAILAERDEKRADNVSASKMVEKIPGVDFFLTGYAYATRKADAKGRVQGYYRYSFRLTDAETDIVVWEDDYEFKKVGRRGTVYR